MNDLNGIIPFVREFGALNTVLFLLLFSMLSLAGIIILRQGKALEELKKDQAVHHETQLTVLKKLESISLDVRSLRDSERDCLANLREQLAVHARTCEAGQRAQCSMGADVDAIGRSVDKLVTVLTMKRRMES